jgi:hypothetical protein
MAKHKFNSSLRYKDFIYQRDKVLEQIYNNHLIMVSDYMRRAFESIIKDAHILSKDSQSVQMATGTFSHYVHREFVQAYQNIIIIFERMHKATYLLSYAGEVEAMSRAKQTPYKIQSKLGFGAITPPTQDKIFRDRLEFYFNRLQRKIVDKFQQALILEKTPQETAEAVYSAFPKPTRISKQRIIKKFTEADADKPQDFMGEKLSFGFIDDKEWERVRDSYMSEYIPAWRGPEYVVGKDAQTGEDVYYWEVEREAEHQFVKSVHEGTNDAARENGIVDMMWVAIIDDVTDDCCIWRDGLTVKEIEEQLEGEHSDDECDSPVPPAHFNCRCRLAPITDEELPEDVGPSKVGDFFDWLHEMEKKP